MSTSTPIVPPVQTTAVSERTVPFSPWKLIDRGPALVTEAMEIPGRGVLVRCYNDDPDDAIVARLRLTSLVHITGTTIRGFDENGDEVYDTLKAGEVVTWKLI